MQFKLTTDYAIRTLLYLAMTNTVTTSAEISEHMGIPQKYLIKLLSELRRSELVNVHMGVKGGYTLNRDPKDISMLDIAAITEGTIKLNRCLETDAYCSRGEASCCPLRKCCVILQTRFENALANITVQDLIDDTAAEQFLA